MTFDVVHGTRLSRPNFFFDRLGSSAAVDVSRGCRIQGRNAKMNALARRMGITFWGLDDESCGARVFTSLFYSQIRGLHALLEAVVAERRGLYSPTMSTFDFAGILSSRPSAQ